MILGGDLLPHCMATDWIHLYAVPATNLLKTLEFSRRVERSFVTPTRTEHADAGSLIGSKLIHTLMEWRTDSSMTQDTYIKARG